MTPTIPSAPLTSNAQPILYVKTGCPWCAEAEHELRARGIPYHLRNVTIDRSARADMERVSGQTKAPTLDWYGEILADFGAAELRPFLATRQPAAR